MAKGKKYPLLSFIIFLLTAAVLCLTALTLYTPVMQSFYPKKYAEAVEKYSQEYGVDEILIYAVIRTESGFKPDSVSSAGARGLTQITEDTFDWLLMKSGEEYDFDDLFNPEVSIEYGTYFLSILLKEYGSVETSVAAYHAGMGNVSSWLDDSQYSDDGINLKKIPISDTNHYVNKVMSAVDKYNKLYGG